MKHMQGYNYCIKQYTYLPVENTQNFITNGKTKQHFAIKFNGFSERNV